MVLHRAGLNVVASLPKSMLARALGLTGLSLTLLLACGVGTESTAGSEDAVEVAADRLPFEVRSGSRLAAQVVTVGARQIPFSLYDTKLAAPCHFFDALGEGIERCYPSVGYLVSVFLDERCTVLGVKNPEPRQALAATDIPRGAHAARRFVELGDAATPREVYRLAPDGVCRAEPVGPTDSFRRARTMEPTEMVAGRIEPVPVDDAVALERIAAEDGAVWSRSLVDRRRSEPCHFRTSGGPKACVPNETAHVGSDFGDSACSFPLARARSAARISTATRYDACANIVEIRSLGRRVATDAQVFFKHDPDRCTPLAQSPAYAHYELGEVLPASDFPALETRLTDDTPRIGVSETRTASGRLVGAWITDRERGAACWTYDLGDGILRCVGGVTHGIAAFSDASCSTLVQWVPESACTPDPPPRYFLHQRPEGGAASVHEIGADVTGPMYRRGLDGRCEQLVASGPARALRPVSADVFPPVTIRRLACQSGGACGVACRGEAECASNEQCTGGVCVPRPASPAPPPTTTGTPAPPAPPPPTTGTPAPPPPPTTTGTPAPPPPPPPPTATSTPLPPAPDAGIPPPPPAVDTYPDELPRPPPASPAPNEASEAPPIKARAAAASSTCAAAPGSHGGSGGLLALAALALAACRRRRISRAARTSAG